MRFLTERKWLPAYVTRVEHLLTSIVDPRVASPHLKPAPSPWWCCGAAYQPGEPAIVAPWKA